MKRTRTHQKPTDSHASRPFFSTGSHTSEATPFFSSPSSLRSGSRSAPIVQAKLAIGQPNDQYEQEADRVADQVMRMPEPNIQRMCPECKEEMQRQPLQEDKKKQSTLQTKPLAESITPMVQRLPGSAEEEKKKQGEETLQPKTTSSEPPTASNTLQKQISALQGGGQPLPAAERAFFEPRFGHDFSQVKIHTDSQADATVRAVNARAFTVRKDIVFGAGQYAPGTQEGKRLLAHELTHTMQQNNLSKVTPSVQRQLFPPVPIIVRTSPAGIEVNAVDARQERSTPWYNPARYTGPLTNFFRGDVTMTNTASMVANVIAFLHGRRMHRLNIMDHGNQNGVEIGDDWIAGAADVARFAGVLGSLRPHFASGAIVHMQNCHAGQNRSVICALASTFGTPVYAGTGAHNPLYGFNFGDYVRCDSNGTFNPNAGRPSTPTPPPVSSSEMA